jgi:hypothetical protein
MRKAFLLALLLTSCAVDTPPKYSEEVSQVVYATYDSIENARIELAKEYSDQTVRLITPPKQRIPIKPIIVSCPPTKPGERSTDRRVVIVPPEYGKDEVVVVGSKEYQELMDKVVLASQLQIDLNNLKRAKGEVDLALIKEQARVEKLEEDFNKAQVKLKENQTSLLKRDLIIASMGLLIGVYVYLKMKGLVPFI